MFFSRSVVGPHRDPVGRHQEQGHHRKEGQDAVVQHHNGLRRLGKLKAHRHCLHQKHPENVDQRQRQEGLDAKRLEDFASIVVQLVGKGHDGLHQPQERVGQVGHVAIRLVGGPFIGHHNQGVQKVAQQKEKTLPADDAKQRNGHRNASNNDQRIHG